MATTTIPWSDGSGDNIYLAYPSASGDQTVSVTSDANGGAARSKVVTFTATGVTPATLTINQEAGSPPSYVSDGLVLWLDGIEKGGTTAWVDKVSGYSFTKHGATFNDDNVSFDGNDYLNNTTFSPPNSDTGTIEVVLDSSVFMSSATVLFTGRTTGSIAFYIGVSGYIVFGNGNTASHKRARALATLSKASFSLSTARQMQNGVQMTTNSTDYITGINSNNYVGRRSSGNYFQGKIYSIRIYNRKLTEAEVLANLAVDNARFNLGLTL